MSDYTYCVIGGGIVGLATAYKLLSADPGATLLLLEAENTLAKHQTGHNSGVIHSGIYYEPGSLKARFSKAGAQQTKDFCREHGIDFDECGKLLVATNKVEETRLQALKERAAIHGLEVQWLSQTQLREREPNIAGISALLIPSTGIVDYTQVARKLAELITANGGTVRIGTRVQGLFETEEYVEVQTAGETITCDQLLVCAGLQADRMAELAGLKTEVQIIPFRGEYFKLPAHKSDYVKHLIYPVPDPALPFLGVHLSPTIGGEITVGPSAVLGMSREGYPKFSISLRDSARMLLFPGLWRVARANIMTGAREILNSLFKFRYLRECQKYAPALKASDLLPYEAGIRAQAVREDGTLLHDFLLSETPRMVHVLNAPSPAATAALPIGEHLAALVTERSAETSS